jgi:hypothetical protein
MEAVLDLISLQVRQNRRTERLTVLRRPGGRWGRSEVIRLTVNLPAEVIGHPKHPEYLIIRGHFTHAETLDALKGAEPYEVKEVVGLDSPALPFWTGF